jgi:hypothetical protein
MNLRKIPTLGDIPALSGNWESTFTTVCSNSASWNSTNFNEISVVNTISAADINLTGATLLTGTFKSTGLFYTLNINGSAMYLPLYKLN